MLLSEAIILGDMLKKPDPAQVISYDGTSGCAFGGALLATGVTGNQFLVESLNTSAPMYELACVRSRWPWITYSHIATISGLYREVVGGHKTLEDVAAYVRTVEPAEQSSASILDAEIEVFATTTKGK